MKYILRAATWAPFVTKIEYTPVVAPLSCKKNISLIEQVPTDIRPPNPKPHRARVPMRALKFGESPDPILPIIVMKLARRVMGRLP